MSNPLLDIDDSIIKKNLLLVDKKQEDEELDNLMKNFEAEKIPSVTFRPLPGICIKTRTENGEKVFINLCHTTEIPPPEDISEEKFYAILEEEPPSWCIPMSVGHERFESSKDGTKCLTYDIAVNTNYFKKIQAEKHFLTFTILTMISAIEAKHDKTLNSNDYIVLKNRKVTGKLHDHRVQKREIRKPVMPKPLIEDISNDKKSKNNIGENKESNMNAISKLISDDQKYIILIKKSRTNDNKTLIGYFKIPNQCRDKDVDVSVNEDRIVVEVVGFNYLIDLFVPYNINENKVVATIDPNFQILRLDMPVISP